MIATTLRAYEYSPGLPGRGKYHRNVYFRGDAYPELAVSFFDAPSAPDLWRALEESCNEDCDFLTIPHNMNRAWGLPYGDTTRFAGCGLPILTDRGGTSLGPISGLLAAMDQACASLRKTGRFPKGARLSPDLSAWPEPRRCGR